MCLTLPSLLAYPHFRPLSRKAITILHKIFSRFLDHRTLVARLEYSVCPKILNEGRQTRPPPQPNSHDQHGDENEYVKSIRNGKTPSDPSRWFLGARLQ